MALLAPSVLRTQNPVRPNTGSYDWTVPNVGTDQAKVAVVLVESAEETGTIVDGVLGVSEAFSIRRAGGRG